MPSSTKKVGRVNQACCVRIFWSCDTNRTPDRDPVMDTSINYYQVYQRSTWQTNGFFGVAHRSREDSKAATSTKISNMKAGWRFTNPEFGDRPGAG